MEKMRFKMEIIGLYSFYDEKAERFDTPFSAQSDIFALRHFQMAINKEGSILNTYPQDFSLKRLASFNVLTGLITHEIIDIQNGGILKNENSNEA